MNSDDVFKAIDAQNQSDKLARAISALNELEVDGWVPSQVDQLTNCKNMLGRKQFGLSKIPRSFRRNMIFQEAESV